MSETARSRDRLSQYIIGDYILDAGFGGTKCHDRAITLDMPTPYCPSLEGHHQILRGDYRSMPYICDNAFTTVWSSHCIEDWLIDEQISIMREFRRILQPGGHLILIAPDEPTYAEICRASGQIHNDNHKYPDYTLKFFKRHVLAQTAGWDIVYEIPLVDEYSWNLVLKKL